LLKVRQKKILTDLCKMFNIFFDYSKRKDGFMGQENRRYWIIKNTGAKIRITEKQYDKLTSDKRQARRDNMKKKMTMEDAINRIREAVEYYDMVHDTGEEKQTLKNKDYVWKGYDRLMEILKEQASEQKE